MELATHSCPAVTAGQHCPKVNESCARQDTDTNAGVLHTTHWAETVEKGNLKISQLSQTNLNKVAHLK